MNDWYIDAKCQGFDTEFFYPLGNTNRKPEKYCTDCRVKNECLDAALLEEGDTRRSLRFGVRGGMGPSERHNLSIDRGITKDRNYSVRRLQPITCVVCGQEFRPVSTRALCCSYECTYQRQMARQREARKAEKHAVELGQ